MPRAAAVVVGGGRGVRMATVSPGGKLLIKVAGRSILRRSLDAVAAAPSVAGIVLVGPADLLDAFRAEAAGCPRLGPVVPGGERRQDSVFAGIKAIPDEWNAEVVLVHDAARPFVTIDVIERVAAAAIETGAAVAAAPVTDTVKWVSDGRVIDTPPRETLWAAQTPQGLRLALARDLFARADREGVTVTDDVALAERCGHPVAIVESPRSNIKVTTPEDLALAEAIARGSAGK